MDASQALFDLITDIEPHYQEWLALGWRITPWPLTAVIFVVYLPALDGQTYALRVTADSYPALAADVIPIEPDTARDDVRAAWPLCNGFRVDCRDICLPFTRTGYNLHPDWLRHPLWKWDVNASTIRVTLESLFNRLNDSTQYQGRCQ